MTLQIGWPVALAIGVALGAAGALPAAAFVAANGLLVEQRSDGSIFVPLRGRSADKSFWCAVGDFVSNGLQMPGGTRIYRLSAPPRKQGDGILFSLSPEGASEKTGITVYGSGPKNSISAAMAFAFCPPRFPFRLGFGIFDE